MSCDDESNEREPQIHEARYAPEPTPGVPRMTLHIDLPDLAPDTIRQAVIDAAMNQYVLERTTTTVKRQRWVQPRDAQGNPTGDQYVAEVDEQVKGALAFRELIQKEVARQISEQIKPHLNQILAEQVADILNGEIQPTDEWGRSLGPKVRVLEMIRATLEKFMREKVDSAGRHESHGGKTRLEWAVVNASNEVFKTTFQPMVTAAVASIKTEVTARTTDALRAAVLNALNIKA